MKERDAKFAWEVFDSAPFGVLGLRDGEGGYGVPVSPARIGEAVYFHCAQSGRKLECIARWPQASLVEDEAEKTAALRAISQKYCPGDMAEFDAYLAPRLKATAVCRMDVAEITGKERMPE